MRTIVLALMGILLAVQVRADSIQLPNETVMYPASANPGYVTALQKCLICHSADYVAMQPNFSVARWHEITEKMRLVFNAPFSAEESTQIAEYLADAQLKQLFKPPVDATIVH